MTRQPHRSPRSRPVAVTGALVVSLGLLAACSSSSTSSESTPAATASAAGSTAEASAAADACNLLTLLGLTPEEALAGETLNLGAVLPLSGGGEKAYGKSMTEGLNLAVEEIAASGGPTMNFDVKDNGTADPQKSVTAINELGNAGVPAILSSLVNAFGAMNEGVEKYQILALDGGGGTATWNQGVPYFYGTRAISPDDSLAGLAEYLKATYPDKKTWSAVTWELDPNLNEADKQAAIKTLGDAGLEFSGTYEYVPFGAQDYASAIAKLKSANADYVLVSIYGADPGVFANQALTAGLPGQQVGFEFTQGGNDASRGAWDKGWLFAQDYFNASAPASDLGACFATKYKEKYGADPDFYAANYFENVLDLWELSREVKAAGGDYTKGADMLAALEKDPTMVSVYGGDGATPGTLTLDTTTHTVSQRPIGVFEYKDGTVTPKATFEPGGANFQTAE
jgi:branched-chain amino acid transport system substrate-binding protein